MQSYDTKNSPYQDTFRGPLRRPCLLYLSGLVLLLLLRLALARSQRLALTKTPVVVGDWVRVTQECFANERGEWVPNTRFAFKSLDGAHLGTNKKAALPSDLMEGFAIICEEPDHSRIPFRPQVRLAIAKMLWKLCKTALQRPTLLAAWTSCGLTHLLLGTLYWS